MSSHSGPGDLNTDDSNMPELLEAGRQVLEAFRLQGVARPLVSEVVLKLAAFEAVRFATKPERALAVKLAMDPKNGFVSTCFTAEGVQVSLRDTSALNGERGASAQRVASESSASLRKPPAMDESLDASEESGSEHDAPDSASESGSSGRESVDGDMAEALQSVWQTMQGFHSRGVERPTMSKFVARLRRSEGGQFAQKATRDMVMERAMDPKDGFLFASRPAGVWCVVLREGLTLDSAKALLRAQRRSAATNGERSGNASAACAGLSFAGASVMAEVLNHVRQIMDNFRSEGVEQPTMLALMQRLASAKHAMPHGKSARTAALKRALDPEDGFLDTEGADESRRVFLRDDTSGESHIAKCLRSVREIMEKFRSEGEEWVFHSLVLKRLKAVERFRLGSMAARVQVMKRAMDPKDGILRTTGVFPALRVSLRPERAAHSSEDGEHDAAETSRQSLASEPPLSDRDVSYSLMLARRVMEACRRQGVARLPMAEFLVRLKKSDRQRFGTQAAVANVMKRALDPTDGFLDTSADSGEGAQRGMLLVHVMLREAPSAQPAPTADRWNVAAVPFSPAPHYQDASHTFLPGGANFVAAASSVAGHRLLAMPEPSSAARATATAAPPRWLNVSAVPFAPANQNQAEARERLADQSNAHAAAPSVPTEHTGVLSAD